MNKPTFNTARSHRGTLVLRDSPKGHNVVIHGHCDGFEVFTHEENDGVICVMLHLSEASARTVVNRRGQVVGGIPV